MQPKTNQVIPSNIFQFQGGAAGSERDGTSGTEALGCPRSLRDDWCYPDPSFPGEIPTARSLAVPRIQRRDYSPGRGLEDGLAHASPHICAEGSRRCDGRSKWGRLPGTTVLVCLLGLHIDASYFEGKCPAQQPNESYVQANQ